MDERDYRAMNAELKNQTAVEWLVEKISYTTTNKEIISYHKDITKLVEQAIKMEKKQIIKTFIDVTKADMTAFNISFGLKDIIDFTIIAEQYYQETF
jgi:hypothetical protein